MIKRVYPKRYTRFLTAFVYFALKVSQQVSVALLAEPLPT